MISNSEDFATMIAGYLPLAKALLTATRGAAGKPKQIRVNDPDGAFSGLYIEAPRRIIPIQDWSGIPVATSDGSAVYPIAPKVNACMTAPRDDSDMARILGCDPRDSWQAYGQLHALDPLPSLAADIARAKARQVADVATIEARATKIKPRDLPGLLAIARSAYVTREPLLLGDGKRVDPLLLAMFYAIRSARAVELYQIPRQEKPLDPILIVVHGKPATSPLFGCLMPVRPN